MPRKLTIVVAGVVGAIVCAYAVVNTVRTVDMLRHSSAIGWLVGRGEMVRVGAVRPGGPAEGILRSGDEIVSLEGTGVHGGFDPRDALYGPPRTYHVLVRRDGRFLDLTLRTVPFGLGMTSLLLATVLLVNALFLTSGLVLFALRPHDRRAALLALAFGLFSTGGGFVFPLERTPTWMVAILMAGQTLATLFWAVFLHFLLVFPEPSPLLGRFKHLLRFVYLPPLVFLPTVLLGGILTLTDRRLAFALFSDGSSFVWALRASVIAYASAAVMTLVLNYRHASLASRRKLRVVVAGTLLGFLPVFSVIVASFFFDFTRLSLLQAQVLFFWMILSLPLVPFAFAYAIVRHQVIPIRLMIRRGVRYLLLSRGFYLVEAAVLLFVVSFLLTGSRAVALDRFGGRADLVAVALTGVAVFGLLHFVNRRLIPVIDRRFFREAYDAQRLMAQIGDAARRLGSIPELLSLSAQRVGEALHPEALEVHLRGEETDHYRRAFPSDGELAEPALVARLRESPQTIEGERGGLNLPLVAKGDLMGILSVGPRRGDLPYSRSDRQLLEAVAWQLAFTIENSRLVVRMAGEESLRREMEMASEVQRRLFPDHPPESRRLDLAGLCHPAQGVGGDYYDFLRLGDATIALAVADVAGKGISAALLMSVVQASLRSQAGSVPPAELVASMNRLLYRSVARNRFATFFYAEFDERTGYLTYVNAGHNPPLLMREGAREGGRAGAEERGVRAAVLEAAPTTLVRLETGGLVIGAVAGTTYHQDAIALRPGDLLVAFTDGVTEAWDEAGEEFGEARLQAVVGASAHLPAPAIAEAVVAAVRDFCGDAPPHDDITLVVAKVR